MACNLKFTQVCKQQQRLLRNLQLPHNISKCNNKSSNIICNSINNNNNNSLIPRTNPDLRHNLNIPNNCHQLITNSNTLHNRLNFLHNPVQQPQFLHNPRPNHSLLHNPIFNLPFPSSSNNLQVDGTVQVPNQRTSNINRLFMPNHFNINSFSTSNNKTATFLCINSG